MLFEFAKLGKIKLLKQYPIYHITHINNLQSIIEDDFLLCDKEMHAKITPHTNIGHNHIKERRSKHPVMVSKKGFLCDYVPFNFCNRSVMLYVLHRGHEGYSGGQDPIVHLVSSIREMQTTGQAYFWTDRHAALGYAYQSDSLVEIDSKIDWAVMPLKHWSENETKEKRQAEFLVHSRVPWSAIEKIVVKNVVVADKVKEFLLISKHQPQVLIKSDWYY